MEIINNKVIHNVSKKYKEIVNKPHTRLFENELIQFLKTHLFTIRYEELIENRTVYVNPLRHSFENNIVIVNDSRNSMYIVYNNNFHLVCLQNVTRVIWGEKYLLIKTFNDIYIYDPKYKKIIAKMEFDEDILDMCWTCDDSFVVVRYINSNRVLLEMFGVESNDHHEDEDNFIFFVGGETFESYFNFRCIGLTTCKEKKSFRFSHLHQDNLIAIRDITIKPDLFYSIVQEHIIDQITVDEDQRVYMYNAILILVLENFKDNMTVWKISIYKHEIDEDTEMYSLKKEFDCVKFEAVEFDDVNIYITFENEMLKINQNL